MSFAFNASDFGKFSRSLGHAAPELRAEMLKEIRATMAETVEKMKSEVPHKQSGADRGVRLSITSSKGVSIHVGGSGRPQSYAYAFGVGNVAPGRFKHPVWGKWSSSPKTIEKTSPFVTDNVVEAEKKLRLASEVAMEHVIGRLDVESHE